jgi:hypothetical protein
MWSKDSIIDQNELDAESLKIPNLHCKYLDIYTVKKIQLEKEQSELRKARRLRYLYYRGEMDEQQLQKLDWEPWNLVVSKNSEIANVIEGDFYIEPIIQKAAYLRAQVEYLENILKMLATRSFQIRDAIAFTKFKNGLE